MMVSDNFPRSQLTNLALPLSKKSTDLKMGLIYYCEQHLNSTSDNSSVDCSQWADRAREEQPEIIKKCADEAGLNLKELTALSQCLDDSGMY
jgi:hypothetical protein